MICNDNHKPMHYNEYDRSEEKPMKIKTNQSIDEWRKLRRTINKCFKFECRLKPLSLAVNFS